MEDHGYRSLGKFSTARDDILHYLCNNGWANDSFGDVESPVGYVYKISNNWDEVKPENGEFSSIMGDWFESNPEAVDSPELRKELVGHFIVREDDRGFVGVQRLVFAANRDEEYKRLEKIYEIWADQSED